MTEPSNFMPLPDPKRTAKYVRPYTDFVPKDERREEVYTLFLLHMNRLSDETIDKLSEVLRDALNIRPILTRHLPYMGDD